MPPSRGGDILATSAGMLDFGQDRYRELSDALLGQVLPGSDGRSYPLRQRLGEGGQGWVFRATWDGSVDVVVKVLRPDTANTEALARFQREANVLRALSQQALPNPHVVRFYDHAYARIELAATGEAWELPFTVLELVDGETLEKAIATSKPRGLGLDRARRILRHMVLALEGVHARNVIHRDLKPSNVLLARVSGREIAKVTDFGIAKLLEPDIHRTTHLAGATIGYAPPEQFENGNLRVGRPTDVFALAAIFYEMLTGQPAFPIAANAHPLLAVVRLLNEAPPTLAKARDKLPPELAYHPEAIAAADVVLTRALAAEPRDRHATVTELFEAMERALSSVGSTPSIPVRPPGSAVFIRPSAPPGELDSAIARTAQAEPSRMSRPQVSLRDVSRAEQVSWRCVTAPLSPRAFRAISVSAAGDRAVGLGARGPAIWLGGPWTPLAVPGGVDPATIRNGAWYADRLFLAGASPIVVALDPTGGVMHWLIESRGDCFHGLFADGAGIVLCGERPTPGGPLGILVDVPQAPRGGQRSVLMGVPGAKALAAVVRLAGGTIMACGDQGSVACVTRNERPRGVSLCAAQLVGVAAASDGTAIAVGGGGFAFAVWAPLESRLEAVQTTKDLFAIARSPEGVMWSAGDAG
ncbi:MAG: protein kinase domain-containing protein, partial [Polyangiaceae bacterium]